jgi:hypothetical protein
MSQSKLYAIPLSEYLERHHGQSVTERLNRVYSKHGSKLDPGWEQAMLEMLSKERW